MDWSTSTSITAPASRFHFAGVQVKHVDAWPHLFALFAVAFLAGSCIGMQPLARSGLHEAAYMNTRPDISHLPGFWRTVGLLLGAARRRAVGRRRRQRELLQNRTGKNTDALGRLASAAVILLTVILNGAAAFVVRSAVSAGQRLEAEYQGKIVVGADFLEAIRYVEKEIPGFSKEEARRLLESFCSYEARRRAREYGGSEEEHERFLLAISRLPVGILGIAGALLFKNTGRLAPAVILHMVYNAVVVSI